MQKQLRTLLGALILLTTIGSAVVVGILLPMQSESLMSDINDNLEFFGKLTDEDLIPNTGTGEYSEWMHVAPENEESLFYDQAYIEFFNVSDREGYLDYNTPIAYFFVQGELVFDITMNKTIKAYDEVNDYVVYTTRKQYTLNKNDSTLTGGETVLNFNYMWPYYLERFGNGTEFGFQSYVAAYLLNGELDVLQDAPYSYDAATAAYIALNRSFAAEEGLVDTGTYLPHNWISVRPAYQDLNFDLATSYKMLFNATYQGHDYSVLTGESGAAKFFLDLVRGLDYEEADDLNVDVVQLLADIYDIDTDDERRSAESFAAYMTYILGKPSLDWLYSNQISYVCERTALEWVLGIEDPLLGESFPLLMNQSLASADVEWDTETYYAERLGLNDPIEVGEIIGVANLPYYYYSQSRDVIGENGYAYVMEGTNDLKIVDLDDPLFRAIGQFGDYEGTTFGYDVFNATYAAIAEGSRGVEILDISNPQAIFELDQFNNYGFTEAYDVEIIDHFDLTPNLGMLIANGDFGLTFAEYNTSSGLIEGGIFTDTGSGKILAVEELNNFAFTAVGIDGIDVFNVDPFSVVVTHNRQYTSADFPLLQNVIDLKIFGNYLYVLDQDNGLLIFFINPIGSGLEARGQFDYGVTEEFYNHVYVDDVTDLAYLSQGSDGFVVVDISDKYNPIEDDRFDGVEHLGTAFGVYADEFGVYLADYEQGLVHLNPASLDFIAKDELHSYVECWYSHNRMQFDNWDLGDTTDLHFDITYSSSSVYPYVERGFRQQWSFDFLRPFAYTSETDTALFFDETVYVYTAQSQIPYRQMEETELYWMTDANFINSSFIYAGHWNALKGWDFLPQDLLIANSFPGQPRDPFHMHTMMVEPVTGSIVERRDRIQYNTEARDFDEGFSLLNVTKYGDDPDDLSIIHKYPTWHTTFPALPGDMATLFWKEDVHIATELFYDSIREDFLDRIKGADASRTGGAFAAMFLVTLGFVLTSVVLQRTKPKVRLD